MRRRLAVVCLAFLAAACGRGSGIYAVSGTVRTSLPDGGTTGIPGVLLALSLNVPETNSPDPIGITEETTTDAQGHYTVLAQNGDYTLVAELDGYSIGPSQVHVAVAGNDIDHQDFFGSNNSLAYIGGQVTGVAGAGVPVALAGPVSATATTGQDGRVFFGPLPNGDYTLTPQISGAESAYPAAGQVSIAAGSTGASFRFVVTPASQPGAVFISGDAASGVSGQSFQTVVPLGEPAQNPLAPSLALYDPTANVWIFEMLYNPSSRSEAAGGDFGGEVTFAGVPAAGAYGPLQRLTNFPGGFGECWEASSGGGWLSNNFTLTLTSVGPAQPAQLPSFNSILQVSTLQSMVYYSVHGHLHIDCTSFPAFLSSPPPGTVSVDVTF
jgi:hypothetical protein